MPRKYLKKNVGARKGGAPPRRRRLQPAVLAGLATAYVAKKVYDRRTKAYKVAKGKAKRAFDTRLSQTDGITTVKPVLIGKPRKISFQEKVAKSLRPPIMFKRNYGFSAECISGRKGWFSMEINSMNDNDLQKDITTYKANQWTDTATGDFSPAAQAPTDNARFYVDYHSEKIQMVNSSSNTVTGKIHLIAHRRDNDNNFSSVNIPITPINLMMYYTTATTNSNFVAGLGAENTVTNGWAFSNAVGVSNYGGVYNMPGSSINASGYTAATDPELSLRNHIIKDRMDFWFKDVGTSDFSLKPGQQFNCSYLFNDLPIIFREEQVEYVHLAGTSYSLIVEFKAGIVGDSTVSTGNNVITTGDGQLSVIRESTRILGVETYLRPKMLLQTAPLVNLAIEKQVIINADTGVALSGGIIDA